MQQRLLEEDLKILLEKARTEAYLSIGQILMTLTGKGRTLLLILLSLPFCQPLPIPGLSTLLGILIAFIGLRMSFGKRFWLPKKVLLKKIPSSSILKIVEKSLKTLQKIRRFIHPRLVWLCEKPMMKILNGLLICVLGICLSLPLPIPLTNLVAGWALFLIGLGLLDSDGIVVLLGYLLALAIIVFFIFIFFSFKTIF